MRRPMVQARVLLVCDEVSCRVLDGRKRRRELDVEQREGRSRGVPGASTGERVPLYLAGCKPSASQDQQPQTFSPPTTHSPLLPFLRSHHFPPSPAPCPSFRRPCQSQSISLPSSRDFCAPLDEAAAQSTAIVSSRHLSRSTCLPLWDDSQVFIGHLSDPGRPTSRSSEAPCIGSHILPFGCHMQLTFLSVGPFFPASEDLI